MTSGQAGVVKSPFIFQVKVNVSKKDITSLYFVRASRLELKALIDEFISHLYGQCNSRDIETGCYVFNNGLVRCCIGRVIMITETMAETLIESGIIVDISKSNRKDTFDVSPDEKFHLLTSQSKKGAKMSGRLHIKNFSTCKRCSSSIITGQPSTVDPAWNSAHLYDSMRSEERSFRNIHSVSMDDKLNISWAVPAHEEIVEGEGRCDFCKSYCEKVRTKVSMVVVL